MLRIKWNARQLKSLHSVWLQLAVKYNPSWLVKYFITRYLHEEVASNNLQTLSCTRGPCSSSMSTRASPLGLKPRTWCASKCWTWFTCWFPTARRLRVRFPGPSLQRSNVLPPTVQRQRVYLNSLPPTLQTLTGIICRTYSMLNHDQTHSYWCNTTNTLLQRGGIIIWWLRRSVGVISGFINASSEEHCCTCSHDLHWIPLTTSTVGAVPALQPGGAFHWQTSRFTSPTQALLSGWAIVLVLQNLVAFRRKADPNQAEGCQSMLSWNTTGTCQKIKAEIYRVITERRRGKEEMQKERKKQMKRGREASSGSITP